MSTGLTPVYPLQKKNTNAGLYTPTRGQIQDLVDRGGGGGSNCGQTALSDTESHKTSKQIIAWGLGHVVREEGKVIC